MTDNYIHGYYDLTTSFYHVPVAQLVEHQAVMREVMSSTPAGPTHRVLKITE